MPRTASDSGATRLSATVESKQGLGGCRRVLRLPGEAEAGHDGAATRLSAKRDAHVMQSGLVVPFSSSFLTLRLLNCFHHEVRSRFADAGSEDWTGAG